MLRLSENPIPRWPEERSLMEDMGRWWVARVKPRNEKALARELAVIEVGYYLPMMTRRTIRRDNGKIRKSIVCLFPGYISLTGFEERRDEILRSGRIIKVIRVIDQEGFIEELDNVKRVLERSVDMRFHPRLEAGQKVMITSGPMQGIKGVVADPDRADEIFINVEMFNRAVTVRVSSEQLAPVENRLEMTNIDSTGINRN